MKMWIRLRMTDSHPNGTKYILPTFDAALLNYYNQGRKRDKTDTEICDDAADMLPLLNDKPDYLQAILKCKKFSDVVKELSYAISRVAFLKKMFGQSLVDAATEYMDRFAQHRYNALDRVADLGDITQAQLDAIRDEVVQEAESRGFTKLMTRRRDIDTHYRGTPGDARVYGLGDQCKVLQGTKLCTLAMDKGMHPLSCEQDVGFPDSRTTGVLDPVIADQYNKYATL